MWNIVGLYCVSFMLYLLGYVLFLFSLVSSHWFDCYPRPHTKVYGGLWDICEASSCSSGYRFNEADTGLLTSQSTYIAALVFGLMVGVYLVLIGVRLLRAYTAGESVTVGKLVSLLPSLLSTIGGILILVGIAFFPYESTDPLIQHACAGSLDPLLGTAAPAVPPNRAWSFYLGLISGIITIVNGALMAGLAVNLAQTSSEYTPLPP